MASTEERGGYLRPWREDGRQDRGRLRGSTGSSLRLREATQARHQVATNAGRSDSGTQESGAPMRASSSTSDESSRTCPSGSVGAGVGWERRSGIRIVCNCVGVQATRCDSGTWWQTCQCNHVRAAISSTRRQQLRVGPSIKYRQNRYRRRGGLRWSAKPRRQRACMKGTDHCSQGPPFV